MAGRQAGRPTASEFKAQHRSKLANVTVSLYQY